VLLGVALGRVAHLFGEAQAGREGREPVRRDARQEAPGGRESDLVPGSSERVGQGTIGRKWPRPGRQVHNTRSRASRSIPVNRTKRARTLSTPAR